MKQKEMIGSLEKHRLQGEDSSELQMEARRTKIRRGVPSGYESNDRRSRGRGEVAEAKQLDIRRMRVAEPGRV